MYTKNTLLVRCMNFECEHLLNFTLKKPNVHVCQKCLELGDSWVHLRVCQTCGEVNCSDSSKNQHATKHFHDTDHPVIISGEPGEFWAWCFIDKVFLPDIYT